MSDPRDPELQIVVEHSAYYRWLPAPADSVQEGDVVTDSTFPGYVMKRVTVPEPTTSVTSVHLPSLAKINDDREAAGLGRRAHKSNLIRHLEDGPWYKHFPEGTITAISASDPQWEKWLQDHFLGTDEIDDAALRSPENSETDAPEVTA